MKTTYDHAGATSATALSASLHEPSLAALAGTGERSLLEALSWVFPLATSSLGNVELVAVDIQPAGYWHASTTECRWVRAVRCFLRVENRTFYFEFAVPWICDPQAAAAAPPDHRTGGHSGLYLGRALVPRIQLVSRPGLRRSATSRGLSWVLVPDVGPAITFTGHAHTLEIDFGRQRRLVLDRAQLSAVTADASGDGGLGTIDEARLRGLVRDGGAQNRRFSPSTLSAIDAVLGRANTTWRERVVAIGEHALAHTTAEQQHLVDELGDEALEYRPYGDLLRRVIARGVLRGQRDYLASDGARWSHSAEDVDAGIKRLVARVRSRALAEIDEILRPGSPGGVIAPAETRNTVATLEAERAITRYGPGGERRRGANRLWLRGIHPARRGEICPLLTPESEDLGLVRSAALHAVPTATGLAAADVTGPGDLSVAAGLIPFVNHTDPTRASIAARMLRQAVPVRGAQRSRIETAVADRVADEVGVCRAPLAGTVVALGPDVVTIEPAAGGDHVTLGFGPASSSTTTVDGTWRTLVKVGDELYTGDIVAAAPDVVIDDDGTPHLAQGRDCLVAYMPWDGWNFEDAIVVSESVAAELTSSHTIRLREPLDLVRGELPVIVARVGSAVEAGSPIVEVTADGRSRRTVRAAASGAVAAVDLVGDELHVELRVERPLEIGDKLTNRHGAKGVVSAILPDDRMPRLPDYRGEGRRVEVILNPLGVIRRLNLSQLLETHATLRAHLAGTTSTEVVGRRLESLDELQESLKALGAPGGRLPLVDADGSPIGGEQGVVVGWQQIIKLDHLASNKVRARLAGDRSPLSRQPSKGSTWVAGRLVGGAQRLGEMELWALQAFSADALLSDAQHRSDRVHDSVDAVAAHLRVAGMRLEWDAAGQPAITPDLDGAELAELPAKLVQRISDPLVTTGAGSPARDPLHDDDHGADGRVVSCACGETTSRGAVCTTCGTRARSHPGKERRIFRFRIQLAHPVAHPWAPDDPSWTLRSIPLLPPAFRPWDENRLDVAYRKLIIENLRCTDDPSRGARRLEAAVAGLLGAVDAPASSETVASRLNGKRGLLRRALRGRDTDSAARGVLVPDPTRDPETIGVPRAVAGMLGLGADSDDVVLVNRQPTLLPTNLIALVPEVVDGSAFRIHPLLCERLAGDFDGDEITVHRPLGQGARGEAWERFRPATAFRHVASGHPMFKHDLDVTLGLWLLGRAPDGRATLADRLQLPPDHPIRTSTGPIAPNETDDLVRALPELAESAVVEASRELFAIGVRAATGWSFSAIELVGIADAIGAEHGSAGEVDPASMAASVDRTARDSALWQAMCAGQAGKPKGIGQMLIRRGSLEGFDGLPTPPAEQSFLRGIEDAAYFATAPGGLRALSDKKLVTPMAGGLTKSLIEAAYETVISEETCGSERQGFGAILTCTAADGICAGCYEASGGGRTTTGARVGLLAAFAVGERSTQNAMKAFQGGTTLAVGGNVRRLSALFGDGRIEREGFEATSLRELLAELISSPDTVVAVFGQLRDAVDECLDRQVLPHHLEVLWRRLRTAAGSRPGGPLAAAQWPGSAVVHATTRGDLAALLAPSSGDPGQTDAQSPLRLAVIQGDRP